MQRYGDKLSRSSSCRKSSDEMRKVVRDNLQRPSLLSASFNDEKSSSSRSFRFSASSGIRSKSYREQGREEAVKMKAPSLIARLMGLDIVPSEDIKTINKEEKSKMDSDSPTSMFQFGSANSRHLQSKKPMPKPKRTTLRSLIEKEQLEMHTNSHQDAECEALSSSSNSTTSSSDSLPPLSYDKILQMNKETLLLSFKDVHLSCSVINEVQGIRPPNKIQKKKELDTVKMVQKQKELDSAKMVPEVDYTNEQDKSIKVHKHRVRRLPDKLELSRQTTKTASTQQREQKRVPIKPLKRDNDGRQRGQRRITCAEKQEQKPVTTQFSNSRSSKETKSVPSTISEKRPVAAKSTSLTKAGAPRKHNEAPQIRSAARSSNAQTENNVLIPSTKRMTTIRAVKQKDGEAMNPPSKTNNIRRNMMNSSENYKHLKISNKESINKGKKMVCEIMPKTKKEKSSSNKDEATTKPTTKEVVTTRRVIGDEDLKKLLLNNLPFLGRVHELCHHSSQTLYYKKGINENEKDAKLYLACAKELIQRKICRIKLSSHPMMQTSPSCSLAFETIDHLVLEITENIATITSYTENDDACCDKTTFIDSLYSKLEKDLQCRNDMNAVWNLSWSRGIFIEEIDKVVGQIEEHVFSLLANEIVMELLNRQLNRKSSS